jgi:Protein of unknown function (DUF2934)
MEQTLEYRIRQRAYEIWHAHGQADGQADEHWLAAEREVLASLRAHAPAPAASAQAKSAKRKRTGSSTGGQPSTKSSKPPALAISAS